MAGNERHMKMTDWEKKQWLERRKAPITPTNEQPNRVGPGRENQDIECASTRRAAGVYVQNH